MDVAAPAENIVALGDTGEPVNALQGRGGPVPIAGTVVAAAYVSVLAAPASAAVPPTWRRRKSHPGLPRRGTRGGVDDLVGAGDRCGSPR